MTFKPSATKDDWQRWKNAEIAPAMTITRVTVEGEMQGKRAKIDITAKFLEMQKFCIEHKECEGAPK